MQDKALEAAARAMRETGPDGCGEHWSYEPWATAMLANMEAQGFVMVPVEPTEDMLDASWEQTGESREMRERTHARFARHYRAMIAARPRGEAER